MQINTPTSYIFSNYSTILSIVIITSLVTFLSVYFFKIYKKHNLINEDLRKLEMKYMERILTTKNIKTLVNIKNDLETDFYKNNKYQSLGHIKLYKYLSESIDELIESFKP